MSFLLISNFKAIIEKRTQSKILKQCPDTDESSLFVAKRVKRIWNNVAIFSMRQQIFGLIERAF